MREQHTHKRAMKRTTGIPVVIVVVISRSFAYHPRRSGKDSYRACFHAVVSGPSSGFWIIEPAPSLLLARIESKRPQSHIFLTQWCSRW